MKILSNFIKLILAVFIAAQIRPALAGLQLPANLPTAATIQGLWDWCVTNQQVYQPVSLYYTDTNGVGRVAGTVGVPMSFISFSSYRIFVASNILIIANSIKTNAYPVNPALPVEVYSTTIYKDFSAPYYPLAIDSNAPNVSAITFYWLTNLIPDYINPMIKVTGLQEFTVTVNNSNPPYTNGWLASSGVLNNQPSPYAQERTSTNWLVLNTWYLLQQYHARFTVSASSQTNTYTQFGALITPPVLKLPDLSHLQAATAQGADTTVESTTNFNSWNSTFTISGLTGTTNAVFTIDRTGTPNQFFRAYSN